MQTLINNLRNQLSDFIEQRRDLIMILKGDQAGVSLTINMLRELEQDPGTDLFLLVSGVMGDAPSVADALSSQIQSEVETANMQAEELGQPLLPDFPDRLLDSSVDPIVRIEESMTYVRKLLDPTGGHRVVVGFFPTSINDPAAFHKVIKALSPTKSYADWMRGVRIIFCDHSMVPIKDVDEIGATQFVRYDLTHEGIQSALYDDLENESLPDEQRVNAAHQLAIFDRAYGRPEQATEKLDYLLGYYQSTENLVLQAFVMQGHGDVQKQEKNYDAARDWYECAIHAACKAESSQATQLILKSLAELEQEVGNVERSREVFTEAHRLADRNGNVGEVIEIEWEQARSLTALGRSSDAMALLQSTEDRCRELDLDYHLHKTKSLRRALTTVA